MSLAFNIIALVIVGTVAAVFAAVPCAVRRENRDRKVARAERAARNAQSTTRKEQA